MPLLKGYTINTQMQSDAEVLQMIYLMPGKVAKLLNIELEIVSGELDYTESWKNDYSTG